MTSDSAARRAWTVAHIVPGLVPGKCGIGDYAVKLAQGLFDRGVESRFIACGYELADRAADYDPRGPFPLTAIDSDFDARLTQALAHLDVDVLILHYTGYGYARTGSPSWLADAVAAFGKRTGTRVVTFFHETWERPSLLSRALYRTYFQRRVVGRLQRASDAIVANTQARAERLAAGHPGGCACLPVFSNVGENFDVAGKTPGLAVVFGLERRRRQTWAALAAAPDLVRGLGITAIIDIGSPRIEIPEALRPMTTVLGQLDDWAVSDRLASATTAFILYDSVELGKSGVFAAFAAHGLCVVNLGDETGEGTNRLIRRRHFLQSDDVARHGHAAADRAAIAAALLDWYVPHGLASNVDAFMQLIQKPGGQTIATPVPASSSSGRHS